MGGGSWSDSEFHARASLRAASGTPTFKHTEDISVGRVAAKVHEDLDPAGIKINGRESRDSDAHPEAEPIAVFFDVTGSMRTVPGIMQAQLPKLMSLLVRRGFSDHPAILVGAVGDATCDRSPIQVGQFESGIEIEDCITKLHLEGGGGGYGRESYELALYALARKTTTDHWEKRGQKGIAFLIGDELPYRHVKKAEVKRHFGDDIQGDIPVDEIAAEAMARWDCFFVLPKGTSGWDIESVSQEWKRLFGQNFIRLEDPADICNVIAAQVGLWNGRSAEEAEDALASEGLDRKKAGSLSRELVPFGARGTVQKLPSSGAGTGIASF